MGGEAGGGVRKTKKAKHQQILKSTPPEQDLKSVDNLHFQ